MERIIPPCRPAIRPLFIQYSTPYACARFFRVFWGAQLTTTTIIIATHTGFSTYERARYYTCARDRQTQSHKRKQGLLGPCPLLGKWEKRGKRAGTYLATLPGGGECRGRRFKLIRRSSTDRVEGAHLAEGRLLSR